MIIGTAGHIDHGKTALVKALTGVDTDRLEEEKRRGITISLGFAYIHSPDGTTLGFVDVPGHERFVQTMVAGVSGIDYALLIVAADDGIMPQTTEHLQILDLLKVERGLVVLTKVDLVEPERIAEVTTEIRAALDGSSLDGTDILSVSAPSGVGVAALRERLFVDAVMPARPGSGAFRLSVDRRFSLAGAGTIATGSILSGTVELGDELTLLPGGLSARVRSIHAQNAKVARAVAGDRCALALIGRGIEREALHHGDWLVSASHASVTDRVDVELQVLPNHPRSLKSWMRASFHVGASVVPARIVPLSPEALAPGDSGFAQIVLEGPLPLRHGDRFILRDPAARRTMAGGRIVDVRPPERRRRTPQRIAVLTASRVDDPARALRALLAVPPGFVDVTAFAADRGMRADEIEAVVRQEPLLSLPSGASRYVVTAIRWQQFAGEIGRILADFHRRCPDLPGIPAEKLRLSLSERLSKDLFGAGLDGVFRLKLVVFAMPWVRLPNHRVEMPANEQRLWQLIRPLIAVERFQPPKVPELAGRLRVGDAEVRRTCKSLVRAGNLIEIGKDRFFLREAAAEMAQIAQELSSRSPARDFTAAAFRDRLDNGRNTTIEILEFFDRGGLTRRRGDARSVVRDPAGWLGRPGEAR